MAQVNSDGQSGPSGALGNGQRVLTAAKRGHPQAIALLLNQALPWPGVTSRVQWQGQTLVITLQGDELPAAETIVTFIDTGLRRLAAPPIQQVRIQGQSQSISWRQDLYLLPLPTTPSAPISQRLSTAITPPPVPAHTVLPHRRVPADSRNHRPLSPRVLRPRTLITLGTLGAIALLGYGWQVRPHWQLAQALWFPIVLLTTPDATVTPVAFIQAEALPPASPAPVKVDALPTPSPAPVPVEVEISPTPLPAPTPIETEPVPPDDEAAPAPIAPAPSPSVETPEPSPLPPVDPWQQAIRHALQAVDLNHRAKFRHEWEAVAAQWQQAIAFLRSVPADHVNYELAQQKITEYSRNLAYASGNVNTAIAITLGHPDDAITVKAVGDMVPAVDFPYPRIPPNGGRQLFDGVRPALDHADLVLGNFESTLTTHPHPAKDVRRPNVFAFRTPPAFGEILRLAGFDVLSVANNHSMDFGLTGFQDTIRHIEAAGMKAIGRKDQILYLERKGVTIALIGFSYFDFHNSVHHLEAAKQLVRKANEKATIVIISVHMGAEGTSAMHVRNQQEIFFGEARGNPVLFSRTMIDAGADLILGHGPHVPRAIERYGNKLIAYSLGNFVGYGGLSSAAETGYSLILEVQMDRLGNFITGQIIPVHIDGEGIPKLDRQFRTVKLVDRLNRSDFPKTPLTITPQGLLQPRS